jgi:hypothetical protein
MEWMWVLWLAALIISFALIERYAFRHPDRQYTLSRTVWGLGQRWPLSIFIFGAIVGGLAVHFFWNWCPAISELK